MRKFLIAFPTAVLILVALSLWGCSSDDDPIAPPAQTCSIELTTPVAGMRFLPGAIDSQTVKIRWDKTGNSTLVNIDLLKGGVDVTRLVTEVANSGYYSWRANNYGEEDGLDFSVRVTSSSSSSCTSVSDDFVLLNTIGRTLEFTNAFADSVHAGDVIALTWESVDIPGLVDLVLFVQGEDDMTIIASGIDANTYNWTVETFGEGTKDRYVLKIKDTKIPKYCFSESDFFKIEDPQ